MLDFSMGENVTIKAENKRNVNAKINPTAKLSPGFDLLDVSLNALKFAAFQHVRCQCAICTCEM